MSPVSGKPSNVPWFGSRRPEQIGLRLRRRRQPDPGPSVTDGTPRGSRPTTYDQRGLLISTTDPRGNVTGADQAAYTTTFRYDEAGAPRCGPPVPAVRGRRPAPRSPSTRSRPGYDTFGEQVEVKDELGNVSAGSTYDRLGRPVRSVRAALHAARRALGAHADRAGRRTTRNGNVHRGRPTPGATSPGTATTSSTGWWSRTSRPRPTTSGPSGATPTPAPASCCPLTDPTGARTEATYDDLDRQVTLDHGVERHPVTDNFTTRYQLRRRRQRDQHRSPAGVPTTVNMFDTVGQLTRQRPTHGVVHQYGYDFAGRQVRDSDGARPHPADHVRRFRRPDRRSRPQARRRRPAQQTYALRRRRQPHLRQRIRLQAMTTYDYNAAGTG